jgi:hypothetical protein
LTFHSRTGKKRAMSHIWGLVTLAFVALVAWGAWGAISEATDKVPESESSPGYSLLRDPKLKGVVEDFEAEEPDPGWDWQYEVNSGAVTLRFRKKGKAHNFDMEFSEGEERTAKAINRAAKREGFFRGKEDIATSKELAAYDRKLRRLGKRLDRSPALRGSPDTELASAAGRVAKQIRGAYGSLPASSEDARAARANLRIARRLEALAGSPGERRLDGYNDALDRYNRVVE